jgi:threonine synthase
VKQINLKCRECGKIYPPIKIYACTECFGPLEVIYDYKTLQVEKKTFTNRPKNLWRYMELLPITDRSKIVDLGAGYTILHKSKRLAKQLGLKELYLKDDSVNPTNSFKDRPASIAVSKALEFGVEAVGCASTGNLAGATAAHAAKAGIPCYIFIPFNLEPNKITQAAIYGAKIIVVKGTYDDANRLATQTAEEYNWAFVNINLRPYYVEGSKTLAYEVCEQLNWTPPDHIIVPTASGALLCAISRGFEEFQKLDLIEKNNIKISCAQPEGCSPIVSAFKTKRSEIIPIEKPETIAKSLAVGNPADGVYALNKIRETKGIAESATDEEIVEAIHLLAKTEGIFTEPAGGVTIAVLKKLIDLQQIEPDEKVVCYITGNGLKTTEAVTNIVSKPIEVEPKLASLALIAR